MLAAHGSGDASAVSLLPPSKRAPPV